MSGGTQARAYNGVLTVAYTGTPGGTPDAGCTNNVQWPAVDDIEILGVGPVNVSSVMVMVRPCWSSPSCECTMLEWHVTKSCGGRLRQLVWLCCVSRAVAPVRYCRDRRPNHVS